MHIRTYTKIETSGRCYMSKNRVSVTASLLVAFMQLVKRVNDSYSSDEREDKYSKKVLQCRTYLLASRVSLANCRTKD